MLAKKRGADAGRRPWEATYGVMKSVKAVCHTASDWRPDLLFPLQSYFNTSPSARFLKHSLPKAAPNMCPINARLIQTPLQTQQERLGTQGAEKCSKKWPLFSSRAWSHPGRELEGTKLWLGKLTGMEETHSFIVTPPPTGRGSRAHVELIGHEQGPEDCNFKTI